MNPVFQTFNTTEQYDYAPPEPVEDDELAWLDSNEPSSDDCITLGS